MANFKTRARTVDMLGRQQIANASTAISELFKNAHDAYAARAEVDYFCSDSLPLIRHGRVGMIPAEFERQRISSFTSSHSSFICNKELHESEGNKQIKHRKSMTTWYFVI